MPLSHSVYVTQLTISERLQFEIMRAGKVMAKGQISVPQSKLLSIE